MELHYKATLDDEEWDVSSIQVNGLERLKELKTRLIVENEWRESAEVSFYHTVNMTSKRLALTTKMSVILSGNSGENPLCVIVKQQDQPASAVPVSLNDLLLFDLDIPVSMPFIGAGW